MGNYISMTEFWDIGNFCDFHKELPIYKEKIDKLDRIQIAARTDLKDILPILWEEILKENKSLHLRFYLYQNFDVDWIIDFSELESIAIETVNSVTNLEKLMLFKNLKVLSLKTVDNLDFLNNINPNLQALYLDLEKKSAKLDISPLTRFKHLKVLYVSNLEKNLEKTISELITLESLTLRSISKPKNLDFVSNLKNLKFLTLQQCGGFENIDAVGHLPSLQYLQLWRLPKLTHLNFVSQMQELQFLFIETLNGITQFPKVVDLKKLRRVKITSCKNIADFSQVADNQSVQDFIIQNATQTDLTIFIPIIGNKHIKRLGIGYEKVATQNQLKALAQQYGREEIMVYMYPDFEPFMFE